MRLGQPVIRRTKRVVRPKSILPVGHQSSVFERGQVPRGFGLRDAQSSHDIAHTQLLVVKEQPNDLEPGLVGENLEKLGRVFHASPIYSYSRIYVSPQDHMLRSL